MLSIKYVKLFILVTCVNQAKSNLPRCFTEDITWHADDVLDLNVNIATVYDCQADCAATPGCQSFTWNTPSHPHYPSLCTMFHTTTTQETCRECVSGPASCTCSGEYGCDIIGDNVVDTMPGVATELECMGLCYQDRECGMYTWFSEDNVYQHFCFLFTSCQSQDEDCKGCFSGPPVCDSTSTTTLASTSATTSTTLPTTMATSTLHVPFVCDDQFCAEKEDGSYAEGCCTENICTCFYHKAYSNTCSPTGSLFCQSEGLCITAEKCLSTEGCCDPK